MSEDTDAGRLEKRLERERRARGEAEAIAERVTGELYASVQELKRLNEEVARANRDLQAANQTMRDFVAVAAHDLRGPVSAILGFASTMLRRWDAFPDEEKQEYLGIIERRSQYLTRLLDSLLTVSRIEAGALEVQRETIRVAEAVRRALVDVGEHAGEVRLSCPEELEVVADPDHLHRILVNYVTNAFKYGAPPVEVEARENEDFIEIVVRDQGEGIPDEFAARLFHKFARAETEATKKEKGTGLGLSIVRGLAQANDGDAWYERNRPHGSVFAVKLPRRAA